ncbi:hypothetical protein EOM89_08495, partial [Candidatus Falkowbacteria bacterium]|nr:hypothetical protein [Candidatus Falkowbacteria bacterium]
MAETIDDSLRAAAAAGIVTEAQAASVLALHHARAGRREGMPAEDEPFEFFRGFSEIFVSVGLVILFSGVGLLVTLLSGFGALVTVPAVGAALAWYMAGYFTIRRRMNLPSMVLALAFGGGVFLSVSILLNWSGASPRGVLTWAAVAGATPIHVTYLWHMHQPIYYPYKNINDINEFNFSVPGVFDGDRTAAYQHWPKDAVQQGADRNMDHAGAQVS